MYSHIEFWVIFARTLIIQGSTTTVEYENHQSSSPKRFIRSTAMCEMLNEANEALRCTDRVKLPFTFLCDFLEKKCGK